MKKSECVVFVYLEGKQATPAGILSFSSERRTYSFRYGRRYLARPNALPVDIFKLPLSEKIFLMQEDRLGAIRDAAPDRWGRLVLQKCMPSIGNSEIDYLLPQSAVRIGNLDFRSRVDSPDPSETPPEACRIAELLAAADAVLQGNELTEEQIKILPVLRQGSSLGGARPKCVVLDNGELWLAKFPARDDTWSHAKMELVCMKLASLCGIRIPEIKLVTAAGKDIFCIKRFDRSEATGRLGYMSALSLLDISENDYSQFSYLLLADRMRQVGCAEELPDLYRRISFNILCGNTDDHPRNHGFLINKGQISLSPAFDITPSVMIPGLSTTPRLAMKFGQDGSAGTLENLLSECGRFGVSQEDGRAIFKGMAEIVKNSWMSVCDKYHVSEEDKKLFSYTFERCEEYCVEEDDDTSWSSP